jgi:hypothetical protein
VVTSSKIVYVLVEDPFVSSRPLDRVKDGNSRLQGRPPTFGFHLTLIIVRKVDFLDYVSVHDLPCHVTITTTFDRVYDIVHRTHIHRGGRTSLCWSLSVICR